MPSFFVHFGVIRFRVCCLFDDLRTYGCLLECVILLHLSNLRRAQCLAKPELPSARGVANVPGRCADAGHGGSHLFLTDINGQWD